MVLSNHRSLPLSRPPNGLRVGPRPRHHSISIRASGERPDAGSEAPPAPSGAEILARIQKAKEYASEKLRSGDIPTPPPQPPAPARPLAPPPAASSTGSLGSAVPVIPPESRIGSISAFTADGSKAKPSSDDIMARINAAKKYKQPSAGPSVASPAPPPAAAAPPPPPPPPAPPSPPVNSLLADVIKQQEKAFPVFKKDVVERLADSSRDSAKAELDALRAAGMVFLPPTEAATVPDVSPISPPVLVPPQPPAPSVAPQAGAPLVAPAATASASTSNSAAPAAAAPAEGRDGESNGAGSTGSATSAASFLQTGADAAADRDTVLKAAGLDASKMTMEEYTQRLEQWKRENMQVEFISVDKDYKPTVQTWGVFPRPKDISSTYGGGRNLTPGQPLESAEEAKKRLEKSRAMLSQWRGSIGLDYDPVMESQASVLVQEGTKLLKEDGLLKAAADKFAEALKLVSPKTRVGGEATLMRAICLDSMGRNDEAKVIYKSIANHPTPSVAKRAKQMLFGFEAAENLKANTISYIPPAKEWDPYFREFTSKVPKYVRPLSDMDPEEEARQERLQTLIAVMVVAFPIVFIGYILLVR